ncbi:MAG: peptide-methionine (S)-S-oxide reductase MsrA [Rhodospirillales bacterium]|nr:peptide-methionine (S)-S-oxide reductase MsrA [Rhodospirillales bacterium]
MPHATFAGGCFWCLESEFRGKPGVVYTRVGYTGGHLDHPTYQDVSTGKTGHAESVEIYYDPEKTNYESLLNIFLRSAHDPTQKNRQGVDVGTQYRSAIFYNGGGQRQLAEKVIDAITKEKLYKKPIVTELVPEQTFWEAEDYHQQYYEKYKAKTGQPHIREWLKHQKK